MVFCNLRIDREKEAIERDKICWDILLMVTLKDIILFNGSPKIILIVFNTTNLLLYIEEDEIV